MIKDYKTSRKKAQKSSRLVKGVERVTTGKTKTTDIASSSSGVSKCKYHAYVLCYIYIYTKY